MATLNTGHNPLRIAAVLLPAALLLAPTLSYRLGLDQGVFAYLGVQLLQGRIPYLDTWDHAFPGITLIHAFQLLLFGESVFMFRVFDLLWQLATVWFLYRITERLAHARAALLAIGAYCLIYQGYGPWNTGQREGFAMLPVLWGFWLYLTAAARGRLATFAGIGLGLGLAVIIKPTMLALAGLYVPLLPRLRRDAVPGLLLALGTLLLPALLIVTFYAVQGGLRDLFEACIKYQAVAYIDLNRGDAALPAYWWAKFRQLGATTHVLLFGFLPFLWLARRNQAIVMLYVGFLGTVYAVFFQGTFAGYHYLPGLALGVIMIGIMFATVTERMFGARAPRLQGVLAPVLVLAAVPLYVHPDAVRNLVSLRFLAPPQPGEYRNGTVFDFTEAWDTAAYLREHTRPDEPVQVWGHESLVYFLAQRRAASRFQTSNPLLTRPPGRPLSAMQQGWRAEFMRAQQARPPAYIAVVNEDYWWWAPGQRSSMQLLDDFPEWRRFIAERYHEEARIGRYTIYARSARTEPS